MSDLTDKIRKLIAKAQSTENPAEAAAFMNKATQLMADNGLDMEAVDLSAIKEARVKSRFSVSKPKDYEITLMHAVASSFGCELLWVAKHSSSLNNYADVIFIGPKDRLDLATYAADVLGRQLFKARGKFSSSRSEYYGAGNGYGRQITAEANSFAMGWVMEIRKKVSKFALNDREQALIETYKNNNADTSKTAKTESTSLDAASAMAGMAAARDAQLHRPVGTDGKVSPLLGQTLQLR